nr:3-dehydroquinate synthase family protein [Propionibacterium freudenreichii]
MAATWLRGIRWISVPTTVLAMVDAGIGGKTGADLPQGKNLIGAFWEPSVVLEDTDLLVGLPARQVRSGLAEVIKHGFIADERTLELVSGDPAQAQDVTSGRLAELIARSVQVKARVVSSDLRESTSVGDDVGREQLNYGHTLGHAIEAAEHFTRPHGECVALGMVFAAELAPPGDRAGRGHRGAPSPGAGFGRAAHQLPRGCLAGAARTDDAGQEDAWLGAALRRAAGTGRADHHRRPRSAGPPGRVAGPDRNHRLNRHRTRLQGSGDRTGVHARPGRSGYR